MKKIVVIVFIFVNFLYGNSGPFTKQELIRGTVGSEYKNIVGDFNGDRISDIAFINTENKIQVYFSQDIGLVKTNYKEFTLPSELTANNNRLAHQLFCGDFNGDGLDDFMIFKNNNVYVSLTYRHLFGDIKISPFTIWYSGLNTDKILIGDFNGDGFDELLYSNLTSTSRVNWKYLIKSTSNNGFDSAPITYCQKRGTNNRNWVGDFDGDGIDDLLSAVVSTGNTFTLNVYMRGMVSNFGTEVIEDSLLIGDFNNDGKDDIIFHKTSNNEWRVRFSNASAFQTSVGWGIGQGIDHAVLLGDFNGDGYCDKSCFVISTSTDYHGWWLAFTETISEPKEVGAIFLPGIYWNTGKKDPNITPQVWNGSTYENYTGFSERVFAGQYYDMQKCGIDFLVLDLSNGYLFPSNPLVEIVDPYPGNPHGAVPADTAAVTNAKSIFNYLSTLNTSTTGTQIKAAVMMGLEFWDPKAFSYYGWDTTRFWDNQREREMNSIRAIKTDLISSEYYYHGGKPLICIYIFNDLFYPPRKTSRHPELSYYHNPEYFGSLCYFGEVNLRYLKDIKYSYRDLLNGFKHIPGMQESGWWGFGSGPLWKSEDDPIPVTPLPKSKEMMTIMPGVRYFNQMQNIMDPTKTTSSKVLVPTVDVVRGGVTSTYGLGSYYKKSWCDVLDASPQKVLIATWNAYTEESAIEFTSGTSGWGDLYLNLTKNYSFMFKNNCFPNPGVYFQLMDYEEGGVHVAYEIYFGQDNSVDFDPNTTLIDRSQICLIPVKWFDKIKNLSYKKIGVSDNELEFYLANNYPNPFNPSTTIKYQIPIDCKVKILVYNSIGQQVKVLENSYKTKGAYEVLFDGSNLASGMYIYQLTAGDFRASKKLMLIK